MTAQDWWAATVADKAWNRRQAEIINERIAKLFTNIVDTRYWIRINYYQPDNCYCIFFNVARKRTYQRSWPLSQLTGIGFTRLVAILKIVHTKYKFTMEFNNFSTGQRRVLSKEVG